MKLNAFYLKHLAIIGLGVICWLGYFSNALAQHTAREYQIKAVFLYNFANFVSWPPTHLRDREDYKMCVLGNDPFGIILDATINNQQAGDRKLTVRRYRLSQLKQTQTCHILFISRSEQDALEDIFRFTNQFPILTVSDIESFTFKCGMIEFFKVKKKIRISVNLPALKQLGLKADANLLKLAHIAKNVCQD